MSIKPLSFTLPLAAGLLVSCGGGGGGGGGGGSTGGGTTPPVTPPTPQPPVTINLALGPYASGLSAPTYLTAPPGDTRQFVTERAGRILVMRGGSALARPFLDIRTSVGSAGEGGLL